MEIVTNVLLGIIVVELAGLLHLTWKKPTHREESMHPGAWNMTNYCLWTFRQGQWHLVENRCLPGYQPGGPPSRPGDFPEETVRKPAIRID
jgi:hypothetical protein